MRFLRPGWLLIYMIVIGYLFFGSSDTLSFTGSLEVIKGDSPSSVVEKYFTGIEKYQLKRRLRSHADVLDPIQVGEYQIDEKLSKEDFFARLAEWPDKTYTRITILEWRSVYDIDDMLSNKDWIQPGDYLKYVQDTEVIRWLVDRYEFLGWVSRWSLSPLSTLEGYLYPETYVVNAEIDIVPQLVKLQLNQFEKVIWEPYKNDIQAIDTTLRRLWWNDVTISFYDVLILATVVEKEERSSKNRPIIAGIFYNRLGSKMRLDADITLCYGLKQGYESCPPSVIVQHLNDSTNPYNTRAVMGLPPTPIANPHSSSIKAVLEPLYSDDLFYLHDDQGRLFTAKTNADHEINKSKHLK